MYLPDYKGGSIVNLMSSIITALGGSPKYKPLRILRPAELSESKNILLLVIDGIGYEWLMKNGQKTVFSKHLRGRITSVFPPTTGSAIPTFLTGVAPQQHTKTGWYVHLKELGILSTVLSLTPRLGGPSFKYLGVKSRELFDESDIWDKIKASFCMVMNKDIVGPDRKEGKKRVFGCKTLSRFFVQIRRAIKSTNRRKLIYAYWHGFDGVCHSKGTKSRALKKHFKELDKKLASFLKSVEGTSTTVIITSDHGFIDTADSKKINLNRHPKLVETLTLPMAGEIRAAYLYVRPSKAREFEAYVQKHFNGLCWLYKGEDLIKRNFFGLFKPNKRLFDRVGDYVLIMKKNYIIEDVLPGKKPHNFAAEHGGVSREEMLVPLIVLKT